MTDPEKTEISSAGRGALMALCRYVYQHGNIDRHARHLAGVLHCALRRESEATLSEPREEILQDLRLAARHFGFKDHG